jgi:hypothetical protein
MSHEVVCKLYDLGPNELADISSIALEKSLKRRLNGARGFTITAPAGHSLLRTIAYDGYRTLEMGDRKLLVWEDGEIVFNGRVFTVERNGDGTQNLATITAFDPRMEFGYDGDDRAGRPVRDATGNFIDPTFTSSVEGQEGISGPDLIKQVLTNSQGAGSESDPNPGEGPLPIDLDTGTFDLLVPPAVDLSVIDQMSWPVLCGDFITKLIETNVVDFDIRPVDPDEGFDPYVMGVVSAVSSQGVDRSATVHFDYWTGTKNAQKCRHVEDFSTICNKLYDYLGPKSPLGNPNRWKGNITPGSPGTTVDPTASRARYGGPGEVKGKFMQIRAFDTIGSESAARPFYIALWNAEQGLRVAPREMLFITANPDAKAIYEPPADFDVGDRIAVNVGPAFGLELAETQRVYGYDKTWDRQGVARISELLTSADVE